MTLTQAGTITDIDSTTGFQRRKLSATAAVDLLNMDTLRISVTVKATLIKR